ncbi:condensation domain-containing protein, partial [Bradyrhizobium sp. PRIMUS42]
MNTIELLNELRQRGINLARDGNDLRIRDSNRQLTPSLKKKLLEQKGDIIALFNRLNGDAVEDPIPVAPRERFMPLSFAQERMWLLEQIEGFGNFRNMPAMVRLHGKLNVAALEQAVGDLVERHEVLRTRLATVGGQGLQTIDSSYRVELPVDDVSGADSEEEIEARVRRIVTRECSLPFDLTKGHPFRVRLIRLGDDDHVLVAVVHHIAADGWSMSVLLREVGTFYAANAAGFPAPLPPLAVQYADYAVWQRDWLSGERLERRLGYWRERLSGAPTVLEL